MGNLEQSVNSSVLGIDELREKTEFLRLSKRIFKEIFRKVRIDNRVYVFYDISIKKKVVTTEDMSNYTCIKMFELDGEKYYKSLFRLYDQFENENKIKIERLFHKKIIEGYK
jgi:hypothetical protein